jgi:hypothetical protein
MLQCDRPDVWCVAWNVVLGSWVKVVLCSLHWRRQTLVATPTQIYTV